MSFPQLCPVPEQVHRISIALHSLLLFPEHQQLEKGICIVRGKESFEEESVSAVLSLHPLSLAYSQVSTATSRNNCVLKMHHIPSGDPS